ncbi:MAG: hypothetical protein AAFR95_07540 [Bacteroidota bacterium]
MAPRYDLIPHRQPEIRDGAFWLRRTERLTGNARRCILGSPAELRSRIEATGSADGQRGEQR